MVERFSIQESCLICRSAAFVNGMIFKVVDIMPHYDEEKKEPYLVIEIDYAGGKR